MDFYILFGMVDIGFVLGDCDDLKCVVEVWYVEGNCCIVIIVDLDDVGKECNWFLIWRWSF